MCLSGWDGIIFNHSWLRHSWLKIIPSRPLRQIRDTTRQGNPYHHSCYARNVPYNPAWSRDHPGLKFHTMSGGPIKVQKISKKNFFDFFFLSFFKNRLIPSTQWSLRPKFSLVMDIYCILTLRNTISIPVAILVNH